MSNLVSNKSRCYDSKTGYILQPHKVKQFSILFHMDYLMHANIHVSTFYYSSFRSFSIETTKIYVFFFNIPTVHWFGVIGFNSGERAFHDYELRFYYKFTVAHTIII